MDHMLDHKSLSKVKRTEMMQNVLFDHKEAKLEINNKDIWEILKYLEIKYYTST